ncbi:E3 ubiquitin-protein ligase ubr1 [Corchorus capsularis]|uniref:E3 ubiquitin-protein ligase ubr1 n=1 Tax=Corchorus capsularis TaxID=210143 RepID=A0A1R3FXS2_COCAP|nr:E3 ubiquitin-protein ligase ubr1 [Corchorus capsularis]
MANEFKGSVIKQSRRSSIYFMLKTQSSRIDNSLDEPPSKQVLRAQTKEHIKAARRDTIEAKSMKLKTPKKKKKQSIHT